MLPKAIRQALAAQADLRTRHKTTMHTLVISDLHIGAGGGRAALEDPELVGKLAETIAQAQRLVLLGDIIELRQGPIQDALAAASRVLPQLVAGLEEGREVILLMGNHDHQLFAACALTRRPAGCPIRSPRRPRSTGSEMNCSLPGRVDALRFRNGSTVRIEYPGVWLRDDVYAQHGHYLDRHTTTPPAFERAAAGAMSKRFLKLPLAAMRSETNDYERLLAPIYAWMYAISQTRWQT